MGKRNRSKQVNMATVATTDADSNDGLAEMLAAIAGEEMVLPDAPTGAEPGADPSEVIEAEASAEVAPTEADIEAAVLDAQIHDINATPAPTSEATSSEVEPTPAPAKAGRKGLSDDEKAKRAADREAKKVERDAKRAAAKAAAAARPKKTYFGDRKVDRMKATIGEGALRDMAVLTVSDAANEGEALTELQDGFLKTLDGMSIKVKNRATYLLEFAAGAKPQLNEIVRRAFEVLHNDGKIVTGDNGNYIQNLVARPYGIGTARAAGNNTIQLLKTLKVIVPGAEKQTFVGNAESMLLGKVNDRLGLKAA
jgi:hypothetical protein